MSGKAEVLFRSGTHECLMFNDLVEGHGVQSNQFLIRSGQHSMLLDPGGDLTYIPLTIALSRHIRLRELDYIFASHQDPDIIAAIDRWIVNTGCRVLVSQLWSRFLPHLVAANVDKQMGSFANQIDAIPDAGKRVLLGEAELIILPAHFLHSVGNFQIYDPTSKILFSGDMGASIDDHVGSAFVEDFDSHIPKMAGFHKRYMVSGKVTGLWARMVRDLDVDMIVPQHGKAFKGEHVETFLDWVSDLECGIDLMNRGNYTIPD
ncbi:oxygen-binding di-iron domain-containing protein [Marinicella gelatinilytica]|uniref:MBL fold metallo-hydrolase n=1 Tax=Marinicella gelatinilytica TaxID=2996017 RepID=UPI002260BED9|nr:MBL fold metallo-hydrolase [Marinicella gelatinilytica]MCX7545679.1 MBL fold metallo-hydrolase [Marinicella gelatinilytica]